MSKTRLMGAAGLALAFALSAQAASAQNAHAGHTARPLPLTRRRSTPGALTSAVATWR